MSDCNLEPRGIAQRRTFGIVMLVMGVAAGVWLIASGHDRAWRLALLPVFGLAALGFLQAREKV